MPAKQLSPQMESEAGWSPARYARELWLIPRANRSLPLRYGVAGVITLASVLITFAAWPVTQYNPLLLPFAAVIASAWFGGLGPGLVSAVLATAVGVRYFGGSTPAERFALIGGLMQIGVFSLASAIISDRFGALHSAFVTAARESALREEAEKRAESLAEENRKVHEELRIAFQRFGFVAETGELLTSTLNYQTVIESLGRQAVSGLADWCTVDMFGMGNEVHRAIVAHRDPESQILVDRLYPFAPDPRGSHPVALVLYSGQPEIAEKEDIEALMVNLQDEEREIVAELGISSYLIIPLIARGKILGAMTLVSRDPARPYTARDLPMAQDLAYRAALAVDNARLYRSSQEELAERREAQAALSRQQARINALNARLQRAMTETHHRVKNNLQIVAAMIEMRLFEAGETVPSEELERLASYVLTLAAVHDILTQTSKADAEAEHVSAKAILHKLLELMRHISASAHIEWSLDDALLPVRKGTSLALLVNELVSNAVKHGRGEVFVTFKEADGFGILRVQDNGFGFPSGFDPIRAANTGLELVESLSRADLEGETEYANAGESGSGGVVTVTFPLSATE
jgi:two-component sensor histidine kinase